MAKEQKRLFVGGLSKNATEGEIKEKFQKFGEISDVRIIRKDSVNGHQEHCFAHLNYCGDDKQFKKLFTTFNKTRWKGKVIRIEMAKENFLDRLEEEKKHSTDTTSIVLSKQEIENEMRKDTLKENFKQAGVENFILKKAVPGTAIPGEKNWVVGKYGRVLPTVYLRNKDKKKIMKHDPSKFSHHLKQIKETGNDANLGINLSSLTWKIETPEEDDLLYQKRKGIFHEAKVKTCKFQTLNGNGKILKVDRNAGNGVYHQRGTAVTNEGLDSEYDNSCNSDYLLQIITRTGKRDSEADSADTDEICSSFSKQKEQFKTRPSVNVKLGAELTNGNIYSSNFHKEMPTARNKITESTSTSKPVNVKQRRSESPLPMEYSSPGKFNFEPLILDRKVLIQQGYCVPGKDDMDFENDEIREFESEESCDSDSDVGTKRRKKKRKLIVIPEFKGRKKMIQEVDENEQKDDVIIKECVKLKDKGNEKIRNESIVNSRDIIGKRTGDKKGLKIVKAQDTSISNPVLYKEKKDDVALHVSSSAGKLLMEDDLDSNSSSVDDESSCSDSDEDSEEENNGSEGNTVSEQKISRSSKEHSKDRKNVMSDMSHTPDSVDVNTQNKREDGNDSEDSSNTSDDENKNMAEWSRTVQEKTKTTRSKAHKKIITVISKDDKMSQHTHQRRLTNKEKKRMDTDSDSDSWCADDESSDVEEPSEEEVASYTMRPNRQRVDLQDETTNQERFIEASSSDSNSESSDYTDCNTAETWKPLLDETKQKQTEKVKELSSFYSKRNKNIDLQQIIDTSLQDADKLDKLVMENDSDSDSFHAVDDSDLKDADKGKESEMKDSDSESLISDEQSPDLTSEESNKDNEMLDGCKIDVDRTSPTSKTHGKTRDNILTKSHINVSKKKTYKEVPTIAESNNSEDSQDIVSDKDGKMTKQLKILRNGKPGLWTEEKNKSSCSNSEDDGQQPQLLRDDAAKDNHVKDGECLEYLKEKDIKLDEKIKQFPKQKMKSEMKLNPVNGTERKSVKKSLKSHNKSIEQMMRGEDMLFNLTNEKSKQIQSGRQASKRIGEISNQKRLTAVRNRQADLRRKQTTITKALSIVDAKGENDKLHTRFDSSSESSSSSEEEDKVQFASKMQAKDTGENEVSSKKSALTLFNNDESEGDSDEDRKRFDVKPHFEGKKGSQLMRLQEKFGNDKRFKFDARFGEEEDENSDDYDQGANKEGNVRKEELDAAETEQDDLDAEKTKSLSILENVLGSMLPSTRKKEAKKLEFRDMTEMTFDPDRKDHAKFVLDMEEVPESEPKNKKKKKQKREMEDEPLPEVSKELFFDVNDNLKTAFSQSEPASFSFVINEDDEKKTEETKHDESTESFSKLSESLWEKTKLPYDSSESEEETEPKIKETFNQEEEKKNLNPVLNSSPMRKFFMTRDRRLQEGPINFYRSEKKDEIGSWWQKAQSEIQTATHKRHRNALRDDKRNKKRRKYVKH